MSRLGTIITGTLCTPKKTPWKRLETNERQHGLFTQKGRNGYTDETFEPADGSAHLCRFEPGNTGKNKKKRIQKREYEMEMKPLNSLYQDLKDCDEQLVRLLSRRSEILDQIAACRSLQSLPVFDLDEEARRFDHLKTFLQNDPHAPASLALYEQLNTRYRQLQAQALLPANLFLVGFMGAGKSTVSRALSSLCGLNIVEMDQIIAERNGMSIPEIFAQKGEDYFRQEETDLLRSCRTRKNQIVSCGGGVVMRPVNVEEMKQNGLIVLLQARPETILERVQDSHDRPLLENNKTVDHIAALMEARRPAYEAAADLVIDTDGKTALEICEELLARIAERSEDS